MSNDAKSKIEIVGQDQGLVTVGIPKALIESGLFHVRKAEITPKDIETIVRLEALAFASKDSISLNPRETSEGIERFLRSGGDIYIIFGDNGIANGFAETIPLERMFSIKHDDLQDSSPLRQIAERRDLLKRAEKHYSPVSKEVWYVHGVGIGSKGIGDRTALVRFLNEELEKSKGSIYFGYIDIGPTKEFINISSFRLFMGLGAVVDGYKPEVYAEGVPYLRVSYGVNYQLDRDDTRVVDLSKRAYKHEIRKALEAGYIGTQIAFDGQTKTYSMVFQKQLTK